MTGFAKQVVSAGAQSTGINLAIITLLSDQREKNRQVQAELSTVEGAATLASGQAQEDALNNEASASDSRAYQTYAEGGAGLVSEGIGEAGEQIANRTDGAKQIEANVANADKWDKLVNQPSTAKVQVGHNNPAQENPAQQVRDLTADDVENIRNIRIMDPSGKNIIDPETQLSAAEKDSIEVAARKNGPELDRLKDEVRRKQKSANKRSESRSSGIDRRRNQFKTLVTASSQMIQASQGTAIADAQRAEAKVKLAGTQADFAKDSIARTNKSLEDSNSGLNSSISGVIQASNKEWEANARV